MDKQNLSVQISGHLKLIWLLCQLDFYDNGLIKLYSRTLCGKTVKTEICFLGLERKFKKNSMSKPLKGSE